MDNAQIEPVPKDKCSFPLTFGNKLEIIMDGYDSLTAIVEEMKKATRFIWITASFFDVNLPLLMLDGQPTLLSFLEARGKDNIDVRILFWTTNMRRFIEKTFSYHDESRDLLKTQQIENIKMRWDEKNYTGCHHQKSFIIDGKISFCGGVNMEASYIDKCNHPDPHPYRGYFKKAISTHDYFTRVEGPATACIMANFVQRWNEASLYISDITTAYPNPAEADNRPYPDPIQYEPSYYKPSDGPYYNVQVLRTIEKGIYTEPIPVSNWPEYNIRSGEKSIWHAYIKAIENAEKYIYIENQYFYIDSRHYMDIIEALRDAATIRKVKIFIIVPGYRMLDPMTHYITVAFLNYLRASDNVLIMSLASSNLINGTYQWNDIYIHAKLMMIDDKWLTVGSANISHHSFDYHTEMNISVWCDKSARNENLIKDLRIKLWSEYLRLSIEFVETLSIKEAFKIFKTSSDLNKTEPIPSTNLVTVFPWKPEENLD